MTTAFDFLCSYQAALLLEFHQMNFYVYIYKEKHIKYIGYTIDLVLK